VLRVVPAAPVPVVVPGVTADGVVEAPAAPPVVPAVPPVPLLAPPVLPPVPPVWAPALKLAQTKNMAAVAVARVHLCDISDSVRLL
jgi:hypothetical protein